MSQHNEEIPTNNNLFQNFNKLLHVVTIFRIFPGVSRVKLFHTEPTLIKYGAELQEFYFPHNSHK